jgi:hypothetical protein
MENKQVMQEQPYPEYGLSEDTRRMLDPTQNALARHQTVIKNLLDEICRPAHIPYKPKHADLIARLKHVAVDLDLSGQQDAWQAVSEAIEALGG